MELPKKIRKPLVEKRRRRRINDSLEQLKTILLQQNTALATGHLGHLAPEASRPAKLEKADILEMTIQYIRQLQATASATASESKPPRPRPMRRILGELSNGQSRTECNGQIGRKRPEESGSPWRPW